MKLIKSKNANINYLAKVVKIENFTPHPNADALKIAKADGYNIIVGLDEQPGLFVYFPTLSEINPQLLSFANLYRHNEKNANPEAKPGFFEDKGKVTAIKLRGVVSEGFLLPAQVIENFIISSVNVNIDLNDFVNTEFDTVEHDGKEFWINKKYIVVRKFTPGNAGNGFNRRNKNLKKFDRVVDGQFNFHYDTVLCRKDPYCINKDDIISVTTKYHGTSAIFANVLTYKPLNLYQKLTGFLRYGSWANKIKQYDYLYASRTVVKNQYINKEVSSGYYGCDVWGEAMKVIQPYLEKGLTLYCELIGFLPNGGYIQKNHDYMCIPPVEGETYIEGKHYKILVYRITSTNVDGIIHEFSAREVQQWCERKGLTAVKELYYGKAEDLYPDIKNVENWNDTFWDKMANDRNFYMELPSPDCNNKVPHEGVVIKKEDGRSHAWKLKTFAHINMELKDDESNIEDEN